MIINDDNNLFDDDYEPQRTIDEVLDIEGGIIIKSDEYFKQSEEVIIADRRRLQEAIQGVSPPKYVCAYCKQLVKLQGRQTRRGEVSFFAHLYDSDDCEIKTNSNLSKEEIEARKYSNINESERHKILKNKIADILSTTPDFENVTIEKRITLDLPYSYWKRPDIYAEYKGREIVFELQLSTTFLSVVVERDIFYRMKKSFIVWVFNFADNQEYVNLNNLMCKDIYYANKRNAFIFDTEAQRLSEITGELHLLCNWFEPIIENGTYNQGNDIVKNEYIKFSDLKFDDDTYKPYYIDADALFAPYHRKYHDTRKNDYNASLIDLEEWHKKRLEKLIEKQKDKDNIQRIKDEKNRELKEQIKNGEFKLQRFSKNDKFGFECNGTIIVEPTYSDATEITDSGYAKVKKNKKYGFINMFGELVVPCDYIETFDICNNKCVVRRKNDWYCLNIEEKTENLINYSSIKIEELTEQIKNGEFKLKRFSKNDKFGFECNGTIIVEPTYSDATEITDSGYAKVKKNKKYGFINMFGELVVPCDYIEAFEICNNKCVVRRKTDWYCLNIEEKTESLINCYSIEKFKNSDRLLKVIHRQTQKVFSGTNRGGYNTYSNEHTDNFCLLSMDGINIDDTKYEAIGDFFEGIANVKKNDYWGCINEDGKVVVPFEFAVIYPYGDRKAKARKNFYWGVIDERGNTVIQFNFKEIGEFINGKANAKAKNSNWGVIDDCGNTIIPFDFKEIGEFIDGKAKAKKDSYWGIIDEYGNELIEKELVQKNGHIRIKKFGMKGIIDSDGNTLIPLDYREIGKFIDGKAKVRKDEGWGYIDIQNNIVIPQTFSEICDFINGKAKAKKNSCWGIIDEHGNTVIPFNFDKIGEFVNGKANAKAKNFNWGVIDERGNTIIPFDFEEIGEFIDGKAKANINGYWGVIDDFGNTIIPFEYEKIENIVDDKIKAKKSGRWGIIDKIGDTIIEFEYYDLYNFIDGKAIAVIKNDYTYFWGTIDEQGNTVVPFEFQPINEFVNGKAKAKAKKNSCWGIIDERGNTIIPFDFEEIGEFIDGKANAKKNSYWGVIDEQGNNIIPFDFKEIGEFVNGKANAKAKNFNWGVIDERGNTLIPFDFDEINEFINGKAKARKRNYSNWGVIDERGNTIIPFDFKEIGEFINGIAKAKQGEYWGVIDEQGNTLILFENVKIDIIDYRKVKVKKKYGEWEIIDIDEQFKELVKSGVVLKNGLIKAKFEKWGMLNQQGKIVIPFEYDEIDNFIVGKARAKKNGYWGVIDEVGNTIIPFENNAIGTTRNHFVIVKSQKIQWYKIKRMYAIPVKCNVENTADFGVFVKFGSIKGLLHISEINRAKKKINEFSSGDTLELYIAKVDVEKQRLSFSILPPNTK